VLVVGAAYGTYSALIRIQGWNKLGQIISKIGQFTSFLPFLTAKINRAIHFLFKTFSYAEDKLGNLLLFKNLFLRRRYVRDFTSFSTFSYGEDK
jgi:hypothetical protein